MRDSSEGKGEAAGSAAARGPTPPKVGPPSETESEATKKERDAERLKALMVGYQEADREAASELVRELSPMLTRFLAGPAQTRSYVDDMLQDCWLRIHKARHTYRPGSPVLPWIFAIARHTRIDAFRRRRKIDIQETSFDDKPDSVPGMGQPPQTRDLDLWRMVSGLPESQQEVIRMLKVSGMTLEEVARATGTTVGAVKQKAHRAYEKLRVLMRESEGKKPKP
jgi:RNA polymerase sigma-70 factor (ECF subfamily)